jgi:CHAT domain-containing protein
MPRRVWLVFAGASDSARATGDENDGLLTAEEVVTLDLRGVEWVVLSACHSGAGETWPHEEALGMRRAFHLAGARSVIASGWSVDDASTREWMKALYVSRAAEGVSAAGAIRAASRTVLEQRRREHRSTHPFYWAAFTASGE